MILLEPPSFQSLALELFAGERALGVATGFVAQANSGEYFLISNYHVLAGRHPETRKPQRDDAAIPDRVVIAHNMSGALGSWILKNENLYKNEGEPRWREHPHHGSRVDVVALPLEDLTNVDCYPYSYSGAVGHDVAALPSPVTWGAGDLVSIVGFPFGRSAGGKFGIWIQGSIASEPDIDFEQLPRYLIDSRTRPGQSGSPVIVYKRQGWVTLKTGRPYMIHNPLTILIGVYSGRINSDSDLGTVWKTSVVADMLNNSRSE